MARTLLVIVFALLALFNAAAEAQSTTEAPTTITFHPADYGNFNDPAPTVECTPEGFKPTFTYNTLADVDTQVRSVHLYLGDEVNEDEPLCSVNKPAMPTSGTDVVIDKDDLHSTYTDFILYTNATTGSARCGGVLEHYNDTNGEERIKFEVEATAIVTRRYRGKIDRKKKYPFVIHCSILRDLNTTSTNNNFTVNSALVDVGSAVDVAAELEFTATLALYNNDFSLKHDDNVPIQVTNQEKLNLMVEQGANQDLFKYVVDQCYATVGPNSNPNDAAQKDIFFDNKCHADSTVTFDITKLANDHKFKLRILAFSFPNHETTGVYFHCELTICLDTVNDATCTQKSQSWCHDNNPNSGVNFDRRRRNAYKGVVAHQRIHSKQAVLFDRSEIVAPRCGNGFIYDRVLQECSNENLMEIKGVYLSEPIWDPAYANVTSEAYKRMAAEREYQMWVILQVTGRQQHVHGVKIIRARQGSVILDVVIKYAASLTAEEAFKQFEDAIHTKPSVTRVMNLLNILEEKTIEYVPIMTREKPDTEKLTLIVVIVVLFVVVFIAGVTLFKVKQVRQRQPNNNNNAAPGFENKGMDA